MLTKEMRANGQEGHFLNDRKTPAGSPQVALGKKVAERQQLPKCGISVHMDSEGTPHYTCATMGMIPGSDRK